MARTEQEIRIEQDQATFVQLVEKLRCYGDRCAIRGCSCRTPKKRSLQRKDLPEQAKAHNAMFAGLHQACATLRILPRVEEFAQHLLRHLFKPISLPRTFGEAHKAGIAACIWTSCSEHKAGIDKEKIRTVVEVGMEHFQLALGQVQESYVKFKNQYFRAKLRAEGQARGAVYDHATRRRRKLCGRDVTGELRAQIYLMASRM